MTENATTEVGRATIDAYLDAVEQALLAAEAPRLDRAQVLHDLEAQIADMLAQGPQPPSEDSVQAVVGRLEPPSHFAAMYGNGKGQRPQAPRPQAEVRRAIILPKLQTPRWSHLAVACFALPLVGILLEWVVRLPDRHSGAFFVVSILAAVAATPWALTMAYKQVRAQPGSATDRNWVLGMITGYAAVAPLFAMAVLTEWTYGLALVPVGAVGFLYGQYRLIRWLRRYVAGGLPPESTTTPPCETEQREAAGQFSAAMSAPAL